MADSGGSALIRKYATTNNSKLLLSSIATPKVLWANRACRCMSMMAHMKAMDVDPISVAAARDFCARILTDELDRRIIRNYSYSLRAFARDLGISAASVSNILASKQSISKTLALKIFDELTVPQSLKELFLEYAEFACSRSPKQRDDSKRKLQLLLRSHQSHLDLSAFAIIQNPWHFAVLEALKLEELCGNPDKVAIFLKIDATEVRSLLARMQDIGLVSKKDERFEPTGTSTHTFSENTNHAIQNFHAAILSLGIASLKQNIDSRYFMNLVTVCSKSERKNIRNKLTDFFKKIDQEIESSSAEKDDVCAIGFFQFSFQKENP